MYCFFLRQRHFNIFPADKCDKVECFICSERKTFMGRRVLERSRSAIEVFKALASPAFILHAAIHDPILEAFQLSDLMEARATADPAFCVSHRKQRILKRWFSLNSQG